MIKTESKYQARAVCFKDRSEECFFDMCAEWRSDTDTCSVTNAKPEVEEWRTIRASDLGNQQVVRFIDGKPHRLKPFTRPPRKFPALWMAEATKAQERAKKRKAELKGGAA